MFKISTWILAKPNTQPMEWEVNTTWSLTRQAPIICCTAAATQHRPELQCESAKRPQLSRLTEWSGGEGCLKPHHYFHLKPPPRCLRVDYTAPVYKSSNLRTRSSFFTGFPVGDLRVDSPYRNHRKSPGIAGNSRRFRRYGSGGPVGRVTPSSSWRPLTPTDFSVKDRSRG